MRVVLLSLFACTCIAWADPHSPVYSGHQDLSYFLDDTGAKHRIESPADWQARRVHVLTHMQSVMGPLPGDGQRVPLDVKVEDQQRVGDLVRQKITLQTHHDQLRLAAYLFLPPIEPGRKRPAVLCLHPTGAEGKGLVAGLAVKPNRSYALELAQRGYITLAPDYPSFGDYTVNFAKETAWQSGTMRAIWDNIRCVDLLVSLPHVDADHIGVIGHSLGGHNAMFTAVFEPRLKAIVSSCGFTRFHRYKNRDLAGWTSPRYMPRIASEFGKDPDRMPFDFTEIVAALAPRAFFTSSPRHDDNFDVGGVRDCIAAAQPIYALLGAKDKLRAVYPDCAHDFPDDVRAQAYEFLDRELERK
jgi:dienelactone hydrolase